MGINQHYSRKSTRRDRRKSSRVCGILREEKMTFPAERRLEKAPDRGAHFNKFGAADPPVNGPFFPEKTQ
jgi:hypothetical protein